eukprot:Anaeramoba_ignava/c13163_g1_i1.p1 GENE.c13163_g1_i1~~c13163_g1_i1.p1  ORF type:complete len:201 (-),score=48.16 c13163_g1_i1:2-604(-)
MKNLKYVSGISAQETLDFIEEEMDFEDFSSFHNWKNYENRINRKERQRKSIRNFSRSSFLQSKFRFCVDEEFDFNQYFLDPDSEINWKHVKMTYLIDPEPICPICLQKPLAPRMTKCGHVLCFYCLERYFLTSSNNFQKCPVCFDLIDKKSVKICKILECKSFQIGDEISFQLIQTHNNSNLCFPFSITQINPSFNNSIL